MRRIVFLALLVVFTSSTASFAFIFDKKYYVVFENTPNIISDTVVVKNIEIGKVTNKELGNSKIVIVTIKVKQKYVSLIKTNSIFYVEDGQLVFDSIEDMEKPLPPKSRILGFASQAELLWFKTKHKLKKLSNAAMEKADELYSNFQQ